MSSQTDLEGVVELRLATTGVVWLADVEAQGLDHLRVRLRGDNLGVFPVLTPGTSLECTMRSTEGRYYVTGSVIDQNEAIVRLNLPVIWRTDERRNSTRTAGGFAIRYEAVNATGIAACIDIAAGGLRFRAKQPLEFKSKIVLWFTLPGEALPIRVDGVVIHSEESDPLHPGFDIGVKFSNLAVGDGVRIARYCTG